MKKETTIETLESIDIFQKRSMRKNKNLGFK